LLVPTTQTGLPQRVMAALMKPSSSPACIALSRSLMVMPAGYASATSAIMTLSPCRRNRLAERIKKLPVESMMVPSMARLSNPLPPVIRTTLARASCAGLSRRTAGVLTMNVVWIVTASASGPSARAADVMTAPASAHPRKNANNRSQLQNSPVTIGIAAAHDSQ
jgi:hypothetical protein